MMNNIKEYIEELTTQILLDNDMLYKVPVNIVKLANNYGIDVYEAELDNKISGAIRYNAENDKFEILVNKNNAEVRQRFTIAHELGHYFLHESILKSSDVHIDTLYRTSSETNITTKEQEKEVDYFAGALLINKMAVEKIISNYSIEEMSEIFGVSSSAMTVRLNILELF